MSKEKRWQFELDEYIWQGEPEQVEESEAWQIAIGLQQVDGLKTSAYLLDAAKEHIEGKIRTDNITKKEWVLKGDTVIYASWNSIKDTMDYDFRFQSINPKVPKVQNDTLKCTLEE